MRTIVCYVKHTESGIQLLRKEKESGSKGYTCVDEVFNL